MKLKNACLTLLLSFMVLFMFINLYAQKNIKGNVESKIALESRLENRLKNVLMEITGTEKIVVIVNLQLVTDDTEAKNEKKTDDFILPGVPIREAISEKQVGDAVMAALGEDTRTMIKKMTATVLLDKSVSPAVIKVVKDVATGLLAIDSGRGDQLIVQQMNFQKNPFYWGSLFYPPNIYWIFLIIAAIVFTFSISMFLFGPLKEFAKGFPSGISAIATAVKESSKTESEEGLGAVPALGPDITMGPDIGTTHSTRSFSGKQSPFSFIDETNVKALIYLIKEEPSENIAAIVNYLPSGLASTVIDSLSADKQNEVGMFLSEIRELDPKEIDNLEVKIKNKIGYLSGGSDKLIQVLDYTSDRTKELVVSSLKSKDPKIASEVQKQLINIDVLGSLDVSSLQSVIKAVNATVFGQIIKTLPGNLKEKVLTTLPEGAAARLRQEIELGKPFTPQRVDIEKRHIINIIRKLESRGLINRS